MVSFCDHHFSGCIVHLAYRIVGNFGEVFNLANWRFYGKLPNLKSAIFYSDEI